MDVHRRVVILAAVIVWCSLATNAAAQARILIDASRDGGTWWGPQTGLTNPNLPHQGKPVADFLRAQGNQVTELGAPLTVTCGLLTQFDLVFVVDGINVPPWSAAEISAYAGFVQNGGRVIYLTDHKGAGPSQPLADAFGLRFTGATASTAVVTQFVPHPVTAGVTSLLYVAGSVVTVAPPSATMLGFVAGVPVMGVVPFGAGRVFFLGDVNGIQAPHGGQPIAQTFVHNLVTFMSSGAAPVSGCGSGTAPGAVTALAGSAVGSTIALNWTAPAGGGIVGSYVIEAGNAPGNASVAAFDTGSPLTSFTATAVPSGTYFIRIRARNGSGLGPPSNELVLQVGSSCVSPPGPPQNPLAVVSGPLVTLRWTAPGGDVVDYIVEAGTVSGATNLANVSTGNVATSLTAAVSPGTYFVRVRARNVCGVSPPSSEVVVSVP